jgi:5-methylcytosine-specific restriction endonuclease McrA
MLPKNRPFRLSRGGEPYKRLQIAVLVRDDYICQQCYSYTEASPHHMHKLSQGGADVIENMVALCVHCHDKYPNWKRRVE